MGRYSVEDVKARNAFSKKCYELAQALDSVKCGGWDTPKEYMQEQLRSWGECYANPSLKAVGNANG